MSQPAVQTSEMAVNRSQLKWKTNPIFQIETDS